MNLNNLYNFKNPIRHFIDIESLWFPTDDSSFEANKLSWTGPFSFRIKKQDDKYRTLKIPNILNFLASYRHFKELENFNNIQEMDPIHKRLSANILTGDFVSGEYDRQLQRDFERLCIYDYLLKVDIKEYYGRIYTHYLDYQGCVEQYLTNMNRGATNGLIMGNYISLYFAELNLKHISRDIERYMERDGLDCEFSYFSDDFYFFCNKRDVEQVIEIFDMVLEKYGLERNEFEKEIWTYETFNNYNLVERYWKRIIVYCLQKFDEQINYNKLYFINQIIYRMSNLKDSKHKKVLINNFFKTKYFQELNLGKYKINNYDYHQLCFLFKYSPEVLLYCIDRFNDMPGFNKQKVHRFFEKRYIESLRVRFNDEQLYFYYALKILDFDDILNETKDLVLDSKNQILISYYLKDGIFEETEIEKLKEQEGEEYWFQNYHLILFSDELKSNLEGSISKYLIPKEANKEIQKQSYIDFYKENISSSNKIIRDIIDVNDEIKDYLALKAEEITVAFEPLD